MCIRDRANIVKLYKGQLPIYDNFGITKQIKSSFGKTISYKSGAYLIIEHTEALHVVDVNSGNRKMCIRDRCQCLPEPKKQASPPHNLSYEKY